METIKIKSLREAAKYLPMLGVLHVGMALQQGHTITITDDVRNVQYVFEPGTTDTSEIKEETKS